MNELVSECVRACECVYAYACMYVLFLFRYIHIDMNLFNNLSILSRKEQNS